MAEATPPHRPPLDSKDTLDAVQLSGTMGDNGVAAPEADPLTGSNGTGVRFAAGTKAQDFGSRSQSDSAISDNDESDETIEDYDNLKLDPDTLVANTRRSMDESHRLSLIHI